MSKTNYSRPVPDRTTELWNAADFERTFRHETVTVQGGVRIHSVIGGRGPALVLLHGFPQHWWEWRLVMPALADAGHTVVAPDLRGFGLSDKPLEGFDVGTVAEDIRQLVQQLGVKTVDLAGHDAGASVAYHWAASHPDEVSRLALMEAFPAGLEPASGSIPTWKGESTWHLGFLRTPDLPEALLANRETAFLTFLFRHAYDPATFSDAEIESYVKPFAGLGGTRAALAHIRAMPRSAELNRKLAHPNLPMPVLAIGGELSFGTRMAEGARQFAEDVTGAVAERCGHWIPEEQPAWLAQQFMAFFGGAGSHTEGSHELLARG